MNTNSIHLFALVNNDNIVLTFISRTNVYSKTFLYNLRFNNIIMG